MGSAGHADNSIGNYNNNRNLLRGNKTRYSKVKEAYLHIKAQYAPMEHKNFSSKELILIKQKIRTQIILERKKKIVLSVILSIPIILSAFFFIARFAKLWLF